PAARPTMQAQNDVHDPFAVSRPGRLAPPPVAAAPRDATSPWAHSTPQVMQRPAPMPQGPAVVQREEPMRAAVGQPLVLGQHSLGNQAPLPNSSGAPVPIAQRVRDRLGFQQQAAPTQGPYMQAPRMPAPP